MLEFFGKSRREYTNRKGLPAVAHNLAVVTAEGQVGELYVSEAVYNQASAFKRGQSFRVEVEPSVFNGKVELRPARLVPA